MDLDAHERFTRCWTQAQPAISGYIHAMVGDRHGADDVLQDVAVALLRKFPEYDPARPFIAWAMGIAKMQILASRRDRARAGAHLCEAAVEQLAADWQELLPEADARALALADCVQRLDPRGRELVALRYREELEPQAISERLHCTPGAVRTALSRLRSALHDCVDRRLALAGER